MRQNILLRMYKTMKRKPKKVFVLHDFNVSNKYRTYLTTLVNLGLIEEVDVLYKMGVKSYGMRGTKGYKFLK